MQNSDSPNDFLDWHSRWSFGLTVFLTYSPFWLTVQIRWPFWAKFTQMTFLNDKSVSTVTDMAASVTLWLTYSRKSMWRRVSQSVLVSESSSALWSWSWSEWQSSILLPGAECLADMLLHQHQTFIIAIPLVRILSPTYWYYKTHHKQVIINVMFLVMHKQRYPW